MVSSVIGKHPKHEKNILKYKVKEALLDHKNGGNFDSNSLCRHDSQYLSRPSLREVSYVMSLWLVWVIRDTRLRKFSWLQHTKQDKKSARTEI